MAWNGSDNSEVSANKSASPSAKPKLGRGIIAGLVVVILAVVCWFVLFKESTPVKKSSEQAPKTQIQDTKPEMPVKAETVVEEKPVEVPYWEKDTTNGLSFTQLMKWHIYHRPPATYTNNTSQTEEKPAYAIFKCNSENEIAALLTMEPGETLVGEPNYERWFVRDFLKSIETPIIVHDDDPDDIKALKRDMIEVKIELKARHDAGEDIAAVLAKTREDYQDLARYKDEIKDAFREMSKDAVTEEDVNDFLQAANKMLDEKGIAPMELGPLARRRLLRKLQSN